MDDKSISTELVHAFNEAMGSICPICGGSGKIKAMQRMAVFGGGSIRGPDTKPTVKGGEKSSKDNQEFAPFTTTPTCGILYTSSGGHPPTLPIGGHIWPMLLSRGAKGRARTPRGYLRPLSSDG